MNYKLVHQCRLSNYCIKRAMSKYVANKICVVTGGADGIGFRIVDKYLENNAKVVILVDINESKGRDAEEFLNNKHGKGKAEFIMADVTKDLENTYNIIMQKYKYVDILVNNAGIGDDTIPRKMLEINATSVIEWTLKFFRHMRRDKDGKGGTIINVASVLGYDIIPYAHVYQASKFAVTGFTRSLGHKVLYAKTGVRMVALCPGVTDTNMPKAALLRKPDSDFEANLIKSYKDVTRQDPDVVGEAAVTILDGAESGSMWAIDGGELTNVEVELKF